MSVIDVNNTPAARTVAVGAEEVRRSLAQAVRQMEQSMKRVRNVVNEFGRAAVAAELSPDGADLLTVYNGMKGVLEDASIGKTIDVLPS